MVTMNEFCATLRRRDEANPEAEKLRNQLVDLAMQNSFLSAFRHDGWLTQAQAALLLALHPGTINRAVKCGKILSNGCTGHACRIHPRSLHEYYSRREQRSLAKLPDSPN